MRTAYLHIRFFQLATDILLFKRVWELLMWYHCPNSCWTGDPHFSPARKPEWDLRMTWPKKGRSCESEKIFQVNLMSQHMSLGWVRAEGKDGKGEVLAVTEEGADEGQPREAVVELVWQWRVCDPAEENSGELCDVLDMGQADRKEQKRCEVSTRCQAVLLNSNTEPRVRRPASVTLNELPLGLSPHLSGATISLTVVLWGTGDNVPDKWTQHSSPSLFSLLAVGKLERDRIWGRIQ